MERTRIQFVAILGCFLFLALGISDTRAQEGEFSETVKIALRDVGNQLLLAHHDSTSLVLPVRELEKLKYQLSFEKNLSFDPADLVAVVKRSFQKAELPEQYSVQVLRCLDNEVPYSFLIKNDVKQDIIPCGGRFLPEGCYTIEVRFAEVPVTNFSIEILGILLLFLVCSFLFWGVFVKKKPVTVKDNDGNYKTIGSFMFYPEQHKLIKQQVEISLSRKECELLEIFVSNANQVVKRDELIKTVWEDKGVIVGRSLDTYISKLRKKLSDDNTIKLTNVHGLGYKLEITD